jgi:hypothetical protein
MATVRWSLKVSPDTDAAVRTYLGQAGGEEGDLSSFVEAAVRERLVRKMGAGSSENPDNPDAVFGATVDAIRDRAKALTEAETNKLAEEAVAYARRRG